MTGSAKAHICQECGSHHTVFIHQISYDRCSECGQLFTSSVMEECCPFCRSHRLEHESGHVGPLWACLECHAVHYPHEDRYGDAGDSDSL
ncbi:MAG TPA: hypothetical protein PLA90_14840 [Candidatus Sumerlaeota bacterium]|nr:hypothetical protein [Candidatus Sumerlaeota bacterium]